MAKIDNEMYFQDDLGWWDEDEDNHAAFLRHVVNPVRFGYFHRVVREHFPEGIGIKSLLDVGCGGGFLSEEFAKIGFEVTGMDPSPALLMAAREHAALNSLHIDYIEGYGESMPLEDNQFDCAACCDVLEHVDDLDKVIAEISRVLKPGGLFFYDTVNRTLRSYLSVILVAQDWKFTAWEKPRTHAWEKFVRPAELFEAMTRYGLAGREIKGISPSGSLISNFLRIRQRARGKITRYRMGAGLGLRESDDTSVQYLGFASKTPA